MKVKYILIAFLIGILATTIGAMVRILYWPGANVLLGIGTVLEAVALCLGIWKILTMEKFREFLNS